MYKLAILGSTAALAQVTDLEWYTKMTGTFKFESDNCKPFHTELGQECLTICGREGYSVESVAATKPATKALSVKFQSAGKTILSSDPKAKDQLFCKCPDLAYAAVGIAGQLKSEFTDSKHYVSFIGDLKSDRLNVTYATYEKCAADPNKSCIKVEPLCDQQFKWIKGPVGPVIPVSASAPPAKEDPKATPPPTVYNYEEKKSGALNLSVGALSFVVALFAL
jgi:hypothetical protein